MEDRTFKVRDVWFSDLTSRFAALARRAEKLGVPAPTFTVVDTFEVKETYPVDSPLAGMETGRTSTWHTVTVDGEAPKFAGWSMLAVIDRDLDEPDSPNVVHLLPGVELDPAWRELGDICDHCSSNGLAVSRGRKKLVVVEHESGERRIVGTTCLHDFLGHNSPERIAAWIETLSTIGDLFGAWVEDPEDFGGGSGRRIEYRYDPIHFLARTVKVIREHGWLPRSAMYGTPTADRVREETDWRPSMKGERPTEPVDSDYDEANAAIEWAQDVIAGDNDYLANIEAVAHKSGWRYRDLGLGASIVRAFQREQDRIAERAARVANSTPVVEGRIEITGEVLSESYKDTDFGTRHVMTVRDDRGFTVWGSVPSKVRVSRGDRITFTAAVEKSNNDETFGFFKRPTKARVLEEVK